VGRRIGQLAGGLAFVLMLGRLGRLLLTGPNESQWNLILAASAFLGLVAWWLLGQATARRGIRLGVFAIGGLLLAFRITAPETLYAGVLPQVSTLEAMGVELGTAFDIIRSGVPPVSVNPGLLAILAVVMWVVGALFTWGSTGGPYVAMFLPPMVMYLQFAVFDRRDAGLGWLMASGLALGLSIVALALERREETGRARDTDGRPMARRSWNLAAIMAAFLTVSSIVVADNASGLISEYGNAPWRGGSGGYGDGVGGIAYPRLIDLRQKVLNPSDRPVFEATLGPDAPPANQVYWRMETLDTFNGEYWDRSDKSLTRFEPGQPLAREYDAYQGPRSDFLQIVRIENLVSEVAPTAGVPVDIQDPPDEENGRRATEFQVTVDAALIPDLGLERDDVYQVRSVHADRRASLGVLATGEDGRLTPMFAAAAAAGDFPHEPAGPTDANLAVQPPDLDRYTHLPEDTPRTIQTLARALTRAGASDFEKTWILQSWFRDGGGRFTYSTEVSTGHSSLVLEDWLIDTGSPNYRTGYCEQFAAAMAVMVRFLEIPSRVVWGFTPGTIEPQQGGSEKVVVRDRNAHAWVEVWLEPFGWVQFDPTPRAEQTEYPEQPSSLTAGLNPAEHLPGSEGGEVLTSPTVPEGFEDNPPFLDDQANPISTTGPRWWLIAIVVAIPLLGLIPLLKRFRRRRRLARIRQGDITPAWDEIIDRLTDLGQTVPDSLTPIEVARSTDDALVPLAVSYASTIYGGRTGQARESDLFGVEWWLDRNYDSRTRARAAISLRSLLRKR